MKRKVYISLLITLFALANVGLPFTLHFCQMMDSVSLESCSACSKDVEKKSCCEEDNSAIVNFTSGKDKCCETKLIASPINEQFLLIKIESAKESFKITEVVISDEFTISVDKSSYHISQNSSPPPETQNHIYIINSVFLI